MGKRATNALAGETSPYLLQHADNPVQWYPWSEEALNKAREENKPILLSVGYSACHWCHVMAHESFEDEETARIMNEHFVNIKVDREERPDLDKIYQTAHQLLTQRAGGWPLTMFLTADDHKPFYGGTYFPREERYGMPSFKDVLRWVARIHEEKPDDIRQQNESLVRAMQSTEPAPDSESEIGREPLEEAYRALTSSFDDRFGGFGGAPKFPHPTNLERLLRHFASTSVAGNAEIRALQMAGNSLVRMAQGGIYDHLGGGFCRYSVDQFWMIPHFEKMLYDNGPLLTLYAEAHQLTGEEMFATVARETADWVIREMQSPEGGYYSTLDADSEGEEGKFYVWTPDEVRALLDEDEFKAFAARYGLDGEPNFEGKFWHLHTFKDWKQVAEAAGVDAARARALVDSAKPKLFEVRSKRVWPGRDEKILTAWNGLMIRGMATAARVLPEPRYLESAERSLAFIRANLWRDGRLLATCKDGRARHPAYLD
ncbi:MAG: thioredoxin domain-containing protein, partial [Gammaproteobacteria bacterium]|nr:thioredoxin domain-containing protein [Gammaproteobacteria bacterium]